MFRPSRNNRRNRILLRGSEGASPSRTPPIFKRHQPWGSSDLDGRLPRPAAVPSTDTEAIGRGLIRGPLMIVDPRANSDRMRPER